MMKGKSFITSILVLAVLCAAPMAAQAVPLIQWNNFAITTNPFEYSAVQGVVANESEYRLADWRDIVLFVNGSAANAVAFTGFIKDGPAYDPRDKFGYDDTDAAIDLEVWVALNGDEYYNTSTRHYFARVPGESLQPDFFVHAAMLQDPYKERMPGKSIEDIRRRKVAYNNGIVLGSYNQDERHALLIKNPVPTPEPATLLLLGAGLIGLAGFGRKKITKK